MKNYLFLMFLITMLAACTVTPKEPTPEEKAQSEKCAALKSRKETIERLIQRGEKEKLFRKGRLQYASGYGYSPDTDAIKGLDNALWVLRDELEKVYEGMSTCK